LALVELGENKVGAIFRTTKEHLPTLPPGLKYVEIKIAKNIFKSPIKELGAPLLCPRPSFESPLSLQTFGVTDVSKVWVVGRVGKK
jgi:hypothetical protein